jgi:hypothetical protein
VESKQLKRATKGSGPSPQSHFEVILSDTECLERALREYRETSWDDSSLEELPFEAQHAILRRAQEIESRQHRLQAVPGRLKNGAV